MGRTIAAWFLVAAAAAGPAVGPREVVQAAVARVLAAVEEGEAAGDRPPRVEAERRRAEIRRVARDLFDFDEMARRALSRHWAPRSRTEQAEFVELFTELLERAYVHRLEAFAGARIVVPSESIDGHYATVRSRVITARRVETPLDYRLHLDGARWRVYDISVDGVSFIATYRSEFNRIIQLSSYGELVDRMRKKRVDLDPFERRADGR
jgi:phospholipid transport system substrate-binding protein